LTSSNKTGSPTRIIDDELEIERINLSIGETDSFIALVEARKAELAG
jgi:hypothetical protein